MSMSDVGKYVLLVEKVFTIRFFKTFSRYARLGTMLRYGDLDEKTNFQKIDYMCPDVLNEISGVDLDDTI